MEPRRATAKWEAEGKGRPGQGGEDTAVCRKRGAPGLPF